MVIYIGSIVLLVFFLIDYWWTIIAVNFVDIVDWLILRLIFENEPVCHPMADKIRNVLFKKTPNWNHKHWTIVIEFAIVGVLLASVLLILNILSAG